MYKLIFIDVDGTLLTSNHKISDGTLSVIRRISEINQIPVILTTARPPQAVEKIHIQLNLNSPIVCFNGALIIQIKEPGNFRSLRSSSVNASLVSTINSAASEYKVSVNFYKSGEWFCNNHDDWIQQEEKITGTRATILNTSLQIQKWIYDNDGPHKILLMGEPDEIDKIEPILKSHTGHELNIYKSKPTYLEITNGIASKTSAIIFLLEQYGLTKNDILAIGDNYNDIEMLQFAGMGIAMGNAPAAVKAHAQYITSDNDSDGIKSALNKFIK